MISAGFGDAIMVLKAKTTMKSTGWALVILGDLGGSAVKETRSISPLSRYQLQYFIFISGATLPFTIRVYSTLHCSSAA